MQLSDIGTALAAVVPNTRRYSVIQKTDQYIVWAEDGEAGAQHADNKKIAQVLSGTIDYFTQTPDDPKVGEIQATLNGLALTWRLNSVQYEDETRYHHHEWVFEVEAWHA